MTPYAYPLLQSLGTTIRTMAERLVARGEQMAPADALYVEKHGGFQCATCVYVTPVNASHGRCQVMEGTVHLTDGCCVLWDANKDLLHLYREPA